jgi:hypothetical protein
VTLRLIVAGIGGLAIWWAAHEWAGKKVDAALAPVQEQLDAALSREAGLRSRLELVQLMAQLAQAEHHLTAARLRELEALEPRIVERWRTRVETLPPLPCGPGQARVDLLNEVLQ